MAASRAFGALVLTAALVIGVPYLLIALVGNPLPGDMPSIDEIRILLTQNGEGFATFIIGTLAVLIWVIWAQLMLALVVETVATVGNSETRRLRTAPGLQAFAAKLIATITLATTLAAIPGLAPAVGALTFDDVVSSTAPATIVFQHGTVASGSAALLPGESIAQIRSVQHHGDDSARIVVNDHTELWDLADAAYGDGVSWKLIAIANAGLSDAHGDMITNESETVAAGTELILPGVIDEDAALTFGTLGAAPALADPVIADPAIADPAAVDPVIATTEAQHTVEVGDSMWTVAETEVERRLDRSATTSEVADYWIDVVQANTEISSGNADLIYPGEHLVMPGSAVVTTVGSDAVQPEPSAPSVAPPIEVDDAPSDNPNSVTADSTLATNSSGVAHDEVGGPAVPQPQQQALIDAGAAGSGSVDSPSQPVGLEARVVSDRPVSLPAAGLAALGAGILSAGVVGAVRRRRDLQRRTRPSGTIARAPSTEAAAFEAAMIHASHELRESQNGLGWKILPAASVNAMLPAASRQTAAPAAPSTSIVVGTDPDNNEAVFMNLAAAGAVCLVGDEAATRRFARSVVLDLAVSERADDLCVIAVGMGSELQDLERVRVVPSFADALNQAVRCGHASTDSATPVIVVSDTPEPDTAEGGRGEMAQALRELGAIVIAPGLDAQVSIAIEDNAATLMPSGTTVVLAALDDDAYRSVAELIDTTSSTAVEIADVSVPVEEIIDVTAASDCVIAAGPIDVKILGPVEITGAEPFSSLKAVDVVTYLAFHRHGVDADQIKTWVWPAFEPPTDKAFANVMSRARTGLGAGVDGSPYLSRAGADKTYRLAEPVTTDFDRFRAVVEMADDATETAQTLALLTQALELIRGVPFTGGAASSFAWADNHVRARVEFTIDETVHRCADLALEVGDLATARWAALKGLELVPGCEQCFKRRFLVAGAGNNRSELRRAMADLEASAIADLGEPEAVDAISGELLDLYHELDRALVTGSAGARS